MSPRRHQLQRELVYAWKGEVENLRAINRELVAALEPFTRWPGWKTGLPEYAEFVQRARAAIARAKSEK